MRIVHAVRSDAFAGVESHVARLARAQALAGDDVTVIGGHPDRMTAVAGAGVRTLPSTTVSHVLKAVRRWAPGADVVHAHMTAAEIACAAAMLAVSTPLVATRHFASGRANNPSSTAAAAVPARRVAAHISISHYVADTIAGTSVVIHP